METLDEFKIGIMINDASSTDALYANGNQQCKVFIRVVKAIYADEHSPAQVAPLSPSERESLTVLPYSNQLRPDQAKGWYCDTEPNQYDEGLWRGTASVGLRGSTATTSAGANTAPEELYRYMRFDGREEPLQPTTFMACITLDNGKQYTTHFDDGDKSFESSITIAPQRPYVLHVSDMAHILHVAYWDDPQVRVAINMYYWTLPGGLKIVTERFEGGYSGSDLEWAYGIIDGYWYRQGMAVKVDVTTLTLGQIDSRISAPYQNVQVPIINSRSMMRGARYAAIDWITPERWIQDALMYWIITDNYGCESRFVLKANNGDKGNTMELLNG